MKRPREDKIIIRGQLSQTRLKLTLVDETTGFIDDDEGEYRPVFYG